MGKVLVSEGNLKSNADAIRWKNGTTDTYTPSEMVSAIAAIEGSGSGVWDSAMYTIPATVVDKGVGKCVGMQGVRWWSAPKCTSVGSGAFAYTSLIKIDLPACTSVEWSAFIGCPYLTSINLPICTDVERRAFYSCASLKSVDLPACTTVGIEAFYLCSALTSVNLPACTTVEDYAFAGCSALNSINLPACTSVGSSGLNGCSVLTSIDLPVCTSIGSSSFIACKKLTTLILRSPTLCEATGAQSFYNSALKIYVPEALLDEYKAASYWSSWADRFASLEEYEASAATASLDDDGISTLELEDTQISVDELIAAAENDLKTAQTLGDPTDYIEERLKELYAERDGTSVDEGTEASKPVEA